MSIKVNIGGILFDNVNLDEAVSMMDTQIHQYSGEGSSLLCVANQDLFNQRNKYKELSLENINGSFLIIPDGYSIIYAAKILGAKMKERVAGPDLMEKFIEYSNEKGYKHFFLGAKEGVAQKMADIFCAKYHHLKVVGLYSPPFGEFSLEENNKILQMINQSKADVLWVSFGCPKQERWIIQNKDKINVPISAGVGAAFDFHSGNIKRAPQFFITLRLEWFYRFLQEPNRLFKRYFFGGFHFLKIIIMQKFKLSR
jgi:N-acetylglucosaminyldiphosphoundecaprenol N-acetyl-beta-D-mannosaminyltransferase